MSTDQLVLDTTGNVTTSGNLTAATLSAENGWSGTFTNGDGDTVTVSNGIIIDVS